VGQFSAGVNNRDSDDDDEHDPSEDQTLAFHALKLLPSQSARHQKTSVLCRSESFAQLLGRHPGVAQDAAQRAAFQLAVQRGRRARRRARWRTLRKPRFVRTATI
jgi:hypothetical protein